MAARADASSAATTRRTGTGAALRGLAVCAALLGVAGGALAHLPHDVVTEIAVSPDYAQDGTLFGTFALTEDLLFGRSTDGGRSWQFLGPAFAGVLDSAITFSPDYAADGTAFVAAGALGVFRSTDRGATWAPANAGFGAPGAVSVAKIAASPHFATDHLLLAATNSGCFRSVDGGDNWVPARTGLSETNLAIVQFAEQGGGSLVAFTGSLVIHGSLDGGLTWTPLHTFAHPMVTLAPAADFPVSGVLATAFGRKGGGMQFSTDGGSSWQAGNSGLTDLLVEDLATAPGGMVFAVTANAGCFRAAAIGLPWTLVDEGFEPLSNQTTTHYRRVLVSPEFARDGRVWVGAFEGLYSTDNAGDHWREEDVYSQRYNPWLVLSPRFAQDHLLFCGNYGGGVFAYRDDLIGGTSLADPGSGSVFAGSGASVGGHAASSAGPAIAPFVPPHDPPPLPQAPVWDARSNGLSTPFSGVLMLSPSFGTDSTIFTGFNQLFRSDDAGAHWQSVPDPPNVLIVRTAEIAPDFATEPLLFIGTAPEGVWSSTDAGASWSPAQAGLPGNVHTTAIRCSPGFATDRRMLLACAQGVFRSEDAGMHWAAASPGPTEPNVRALQLSPDFAVDGTAFAGTVGGGVFATGDFGASWSVRNAGLPEGGQLVIEALAISPEFATDGTLFLATQGHGVFRSHDAGQSWQPASDGLPPDAPIALAVSPAFGVDQTVFVASYERVHVSRNGGASWWPLHGFVRVDSTAATVVASEGWLGVKLADDDGTGYESSSTTGATQEFSFKGDSVSWFANLDASSGLAAVTLDGQPAELVDLYAPVLQVQQPVFVAGHLPDGWHTIRITVTGMKNAASSSVEVKTDGFSYTY